MPMSVFATSTASLDGTPTAFEDATGYELKLGDGNSVTFYNILNEGQSIAAMEKSEYIKQCLQTANAEYLWLPEFHYLPESLRLICGFILE